jgi:Ras-related protein Rab-8A
MRQIWDTAGQERFRTITTSYFRGAQGILLVYDVTDRGSFTSIKTWVDEIERNADKHVNKILIGNKADVEESARAVSRAEGEKLAADYSMKFFETSAKKGINVADAFECIARQVVERLNKEGGGARSAQQKVVLAADADKSKKKPCCGGA